MARLTAAARDKLPKSAFALPEKDGYPINDPSHARNALTRVAQHGSPAEKTAVRRAVAKKYPEIEQSKGPQAKKTEAKKTNGGKANGARANGGTTQRLARELGRRLDARMRPRG
jgi:hypothetical protein